MIHGLHRAEQLVAEGGEIGRRIVEIEAAAMAILAGAPRPAPLPVRAVEDEPAPETKPPMLPAPAIARARSMRRSGWTVAGIGRQLGMPPATVARIVGEPEWVREPAP